MNTVLYTKKHSIHAKYDNVLKLVEVLKQERWSGARRIAIEIIGD